MDAFVPLTCGLELGKVVIEPWVVDDPSSHKQILAHPMTSLMSADDVRAKEEARLDQLIEETPEPERSQYLAKKRALVTKRMLHPTPEQIRSWKAIRIRSAEPSLAYLLVYIVKESPTASIRFSHVEHASASLPSPGMDEGILSIRIQEDSHLSAVETVEEACTVLLHFLEDELFPAVLRAHQEGASRITSISSKVWKHPSDFVHGAVLFPAFALSNFPTTDTPSVCKNTSSDSKQSSSSSSSSIHIRALQYITQQRKMYYETKGIPPVLTTACSRMAMAWLPSMAVLCVDTPSYDSQNNGVPIHTFLLKAKQLAVAANPIPFEFTDITSLTKEERFDNPKQFLRFVLYRQELGTAAPAPTFPTPISVQSRELLLRSLLPAHAWALAYDPKFKKQLGPLEKEHMSAEVVEKFVELGCLLPEQRDCIRLHVSKSNYRLSRNVNYQPTTVAYHNFLPVIRTRKEADLDLEQAYDLVQRCPQRVFSLKVPSDSSSSTAVEKKKKKASRLIQVEEDEQQFLSQLFSEQWKPRNELPPPKTPAHWYVKRPDACVLCTHCIQVPAYRDRIQFDKHPRHRMEYVLGSKGSIRADQLFPASVVILTHLVRQYRRACHQKIDKPPVKVLGLFSTPHDTHAYYQYLLRLEEQA